MNLAVYGTLRDPEVLNLVLGEHPLVSPPITLAVKGYACLRIKGEAYPLLHSESEASTLFDLYHDISQDSWGRLLDYEGDDYFPSLLTIEDRPYHVFLAESFVRPSSEIWTLELFQQKYKSSYLKGIS